MQEVWLSGGRSRELPSLSCCERGSVWGLEGRRQGLEKKRCQCGELLVEVEEWGWPG